MRSVLVMLSLLMIVGGFYLINSGKKDQNLESARTETLSGNVVESEIDPPDEDQKVSAADEEEARRQEMVSKFSDLKEIRKTTKMRLSRLSSRLRRSEFSPEQAKKISQDMRRAGYLIKNPKLLGAFSDPGEIDQEIDQLSDVNIKLDAIKQALDDKRKKQP